MFKGAQVCDTKWPPLPGLAAHLFHSAFLLHQAPQDRLPWQGVLALSGSFMALLGSCCHLEALFRQPGPAWGLPEMPQPHHQKSVCSCPLVKPFTLGVPFDLHDTLLGSRKEIYVSMM